MLDLGHKEYYNSEFYKIQTRMFELIREEFNKYGLYEIFQRHNNDSTSPGLREEIRAALIDTTDDEKWTLNEMTKMFSQSNCWYGDYELGDIIHWELVNLWETERENN